MTMDEKMKLDELREIAEFYFKSQGVVHITFYKGRWYRGKILEVRDFGFVLKENLYGDLFIQFSRVDTIEKYEEKGDGV
ncbi:MAG: hypothetical protein ACTSQ4_02200 [Candidatus Heimdallarchaeaceae archaeon]